MNYLKDLQKRIVADWHEWVTYQKVSWIERFRQRRARRDTVRERRMVDAALERAAIKHASDGRTYYIIKDPYGGINELNSHEINQLVRMGVLPKMDYRKRLQESVAIVTKNTVIQIEFNKLKRDGTYNKFSKASGVPGS
jgi:hypothetical protein